MQIITEALKGLSSYRGVPGILFRHGLWPYLLLPAIIGLVLTIGMLVGFYYAAHGITAWLDGLVHLKSEILEKAVNATIWVTTFLGLLACFILIHKRLILIVLSPFLGKIAEETIKAVKGEAYAESALSFRQSLKRSIKVNLRYIFREMLTSFLFLMCCIIPLVGSLVSAVGIFVTQAKFLGFGLMDFPLEHRGLSSKQSEEFAKARAGLSRGLGAGYLLLMIIPVFGWMLAPTFGTIAGTLMALDELDKEG